MITFQVEPAIRFWTNINFTLLESVIRAKNNFDTTNRVKKHLNIQSK